MNALVSPLKIGKARPDEPCEDQPEGARLGIVPKISFRIILSGPSASGKTNAARWLIDKYYARTFNRIILMSPTADIDPVWKDLNGLKKSDRISKMSMQPIKELIERQERKVKSVGKRAADKVLVIFDDTVGDSKIINSPDFLISFIRGRHFCISIMVMSQSYVKIPRSVRLQATAVLFFPSFRSEIERLYTDHGPHQLSKKEWYELVQRATEKTADEQYPFLYVDTTQDISHRYRRCLYQPLEIKNAP
jgi:hypothetical protein